MSTGSIWRQRSRTFWMSIIPYFRYVAQSGIVLFLFATFIVGSIFYSRWLETVEPSFPLPLLAMVVLTPFIVWAPIRTFLRPADILFLLPRQQQMNAYFRNAFLYASIWQILFVLIGFTILLPLFHRINPNENALMIALVLIMLKGWSIYSQWSILKFRERLSQTIFRLLQTIFIAVSVYSLFGLHFWKTVLFIGTVFICFIVLYRLPAKYLLHWEAMISLESRHKRQIYRLLSWFVDIPEQQSAIRPRRWASFLVKNIPFLKKNTYIYLYVLHFARSELLGILLRLIVIGWISIYLLSGDVAPIISFAVLVFISGLQLSTLTSQYQYSFWNQIYPLPSGLRNQSALKVVLVFHLISTFFIGLSLLLWMDLALNGVISLAAGICYCFIYYVWKRRRLGKSEF